jgi:hypothetical protein
LLHIQQELNILNGLRANAMAGIPGNRCDSIHDMQIQLITLQPRLSGLAQQGPGDVDRWMVFSDLEVGKAFKILGLDYVFLLSPIAVVYFLFPFCKSIYQQY